MTTLLNYMLKGKFESGYSLILLNVLMLVIASTVFFIIVHPSLIPYSHPTATTLTPTINKNHDLILPIPVKNDYVTGFSLVFSYETTVKELKTTPFGTEIVTDVQDKNHPPFLIDNTQKTYVLFKKGEELVSAELTDLRPGQRVILEAYYEVNSLKWYLPEIYILK